MKLPRWAVVSMLTTCAFVMLGFGAWWWVTWPERTARSFIEAINREDLTGARHVLTEEAFFLEMTLRPRAPDETHRGEPWTIEPIARSLRDIVIGRQEFRKPRRSHARITYLEKDGDAWRTSVMFDPAGGLIAKRGSITTQWDLPDADERTYVRSLMRELIAAREGKP
jgi:hypothetical protein